MNWVNILQHFFFPSRPCWQLHAVGHSRSLPGPNGIARRPLYPDLPLRSLSSLYNPLISRANGGSLSCFSLCDSRFNLVDEKGQHSHWRLGGNYQTVLTETLDLTAAASGMVKRTIQITSGVFHLCLSLTLLIPLSAEMHDSSFSLWCLPAMITRDQCICYCVIQQRNGGNVAANVVTGVTMVPHAERWPWALICMSMTAKWYNKDLRDIINYILVLLRFCLL